MLMLMPMKWALLMPILASILALMLVYQRHASWQWQLSSLMTMRMMIPCHMTHE